MDINLGVMKTSRQATMKEVDSTLIESVWYDRENKILHIRFITGQYYVYDGVSYYRYRQLRKSDSPGRYFRAYIKEKYSYRRLE